MKIGNKNQGFTLLATLTLLSLLVLLSIGMLSLSSTNLRLSSKQHAIAIARNNARFALSMAIAELQKEIGPDQRITANSQILADSQNINHLTQDEFKGWLGTWNSHTEWLNTEGANHPITKTYEKARKPAFRKWLVSSQDRELLSNIDTAREMNLTNRINVMSVSNSKNEGQKIFVGLVKNPGGRHAWWIEGENQKYHVAIANTPEEDTASKIIGRTFSSTANLSMLGLENIHADEINKIVSPESIALALSGLKTNESIACMTTDSYSILTNVRKGGLKSDLNLAMELDLIPVQLDGKFLRDDDPSTLPKPHFKTGINLPSWYKLSQYYRLQSGKSDGGGLNKTKSISSPHYWAPGNLNTAGYDRTPIVTRAMLMIYARRIAGSLPNTTSYFIGINPVLVIWNPYTMKLVCPKISFNLFPYGLEYRIYKKGSGTNWKKLPTAQNKAEISAGFSLVPGETKIFSASASSLIMSPGFRNPNTGAGMDMSVTELLNQPNEDSIEIAIRLSDIIGSDYNGGKFQIYWTMVNSEQPDQRFNEMAANPCSPSKPLSIVEDKPGERFVLSSMSNGSRISIANFQFLLKSPDDARNPAPYDLEDLRCKNFIHADPTTNRAMCGSSNLAAKTLAQYMVYVQTGTSNALTPDWDPQTNRAYFGNGITAATGQQIAPFIEISPVPITCLASLRNFKLGLGKTNWATGQHYWELAANQAQGFGNSFAHPMIPSNGIYANVSEVANPFSATQFKLISDHWDRAFLCNDGLWDEWFCSGITNQTIGPLSGKEKPLDMVNQWLKNKKQLPNDQLISYLASDVASREEIGAKLMNGSSPSENAWRVAARYMLLKGGFNVNSTSKSAWKLLLSSSAQTSFMYQGTTEPKTAVIPENHVLVSRHSYPISPAEGLSPDDPNSWTGVRYLTPKQIDKLAEECVRQVRLRGPFLNMADFVNRRLSFDELALSGALQAAIDWDEYGGNKPNPSDDSSINARFKSHDFMISEPLQNSKFPHAAKGSRLTGIPGYVMQGDILAKIGNQIVVRDDTFKVRAYGDATNQNGEIIATAWCEAIIQRTPEYIDPIDKSETPFLQLKSSINKSFGRRISIIRFKWLTT